MFGFEKGSTDYVFEGKVLAIFDFVVWCGLLLTGGISYLRGV